MAQCKQIARVYKQTALPRGDAKNGEPKLPANSFLKKPGTEVPIERSYPEYRMNFNPHIPPTLRVEASMHEESSRIMFAMIHKILELSNERAVLHPVKFSGVSGREKASAVSVFHRQ